MFIYHLSSACDVCLQSYREEEPANKQPHVIPCCHIFCKECLEAILTTTTDGQGRGRCPLCRTLFARTGIKKLHVDAPAVSNEEYANHGLLRMVLEAWDDAGEDLTALVTRVDNFLHEKEGNEFLSLRKVRQAVAERERMQEQLSENKTMIRTMKKKLKALETSRMDEAVVSKVKEVSAQELESQLESSRAEVHSLCEYIAQMEIEGRHAVHRSKGKSRANTTLEPNLGASTSHNPLPRPPQPIYSYPLVEDSDPEMARAIEESMRPQRNHYNQDSGPIAGPSRTDAIGTSHTLTNGHVATHSSVPSTSRPHSNGATDVHRTQSARKITSNLPHNYPRQGHISPSPSPPPQILMQPGPVDLDRMAMSAPSAPDISERDLYALRRSVEDMGLQHADRDASRRKSQPSRRHRRDDDRSRRGWAREAGRQEQMRGVTGLGLIDENLDEDIGIHTEDPRGSVAPQTFEFPGARAVSSTATNSMTGFSGAHPSDPSFDSRVRQVVANSYLPVHQPLLDLDAQSLLSNETTGTWHSQQPESSGESQRQSVTADIMVTLNNFSSPSDTSSIISSINSTTFPNAFLPPVAPSSSGNPTSVPSRASFPDTSIPPALPTVGSSSTSLGFFPAETPRPNGSSAATSAPRSSQSQRERARPRPTRHSTQPVGINTRIHDSLRGTGPQTTLGNAPAPSFHLSQTPASRHTSASTFFSTPIAEDPQGHNSDFGNALGLDLSRDLGTNSRQASSQGNPHLVAPRPRASAPHQHFLRSFSGGL
ncbi:hypothetical protein PM082_008514 [Marasmius tenuissimus]|nr:hypothetical protein PM082_008514 [Marasmius tenuissimus]